MQHTTHSADEGASGARDPARRLSRQARRPSGDGAPRSHLLALLYEQAVRSSPTSSERPDHAYVVYDERMAHEAHLAVGPATRLGPPDGPCVETVRAPSEHVLSVGCGIALALRQDALAARVFVLLTDRECAAGPIWEAALFAASHRLSSLALVMGAHPIKTGRSGSDGLWLEPLAAKWRAFGWSVRELDGHDPALLERECASLPWGPDRPHLLILHGPATRDLVDPAPSMSRALRRDRPGPFARPHHLRRGRVAAALGSSTGGVP